MSEAPVVLITGATDGLGRALALRLAQDGAQLILHGRSQKKLDELVAELGDQPGRGPAAASVVADLSNLGQVHELARQVAGLTDRLDVLVNNAGIGSGEPDGRTRRVSADGHELRFAVNYLAGFDLTLRLLPLLRQADQARVVLVASLGQAPLDVADVMLERGYSGQRAYGQSKLAQITFGFELADRLRSAGITVNSLHPSTYMPTKMVMSEIGYSVDSLDQGVEATRRLVVAPELDGVTGRFFDRTRDARADPSAYDPDVRRWLWQLSLDLTGAPDVPVEPAGNR